ncbi:MAG: hypothetical protein ABSD92_07685 [Candidatus Bathyarchaeia archaeon]
MRPECDCLKPTTNIYYDTRRILSSIPFTQRVYNMAFGEDRHIKKFQNIKLKINREITNSIKQKFRSSMPIVKCTCGAKILVVPDLAAMDRALKNHKAKKRRNACEQFLTQRILEAASSQVFS